MCGRKNIVIFAVVKYKNMMSKRIISLFVVCLFCAGLSAQEKGTLPEISVEHEIVQPELGVAAVQLQDSLHLPVLNALGKMPTMGFLGYYPFMWGGFGGWQLHEGLNVNLGASVFAEIGKHARRGAGFSQQIAMQYAVPLTEKLSFSVGGYLTNVNWQHESMRDAGLSAVLGYKFNEKWEAYVYGQKSLVQTGNFMPRSFYEMEQLGDKIGAAVRYNFSPSFSVQLGFEQTVCPDRSVPVVPVLRNPEMRRADE